MDLPGAYDALCERESLKRDPHQRAAVAVMDTFAREATRKRLLSKRPGRGLYVWGEVGRGKTMLTNLMFDELDGPKRRIHFHTLLRDIRDRLAGLTGPEPMQRIALEIAPPGSVLCIDEVHVADVDNALVLELLLKELLTNRIVIVSTSNFSPAQLFPRPGGTEFGLGSGRLLEPSRRATMKILEEHFQTLHVGGSEDYRRKSAAGTAGHFVTEPDAEHAMDAVFESNRGDQELLTTRLTAFGRPQPYMRRTSSILWFSFDQICEAEVSYRDYLGLLRDVDLLMVSNLDIRDFDAARRFSWLVEIAYDEGIRLVVSSFSDPQALFSRLSDVPVHIRQEHARVVSRILEMTSGAR